MEQPIQSIVPDIRFQLGKAKLLLISQDRGEGVSLNRLASNPKWR